MKKKFVFATLFLLVSIYPGWISKASLIPDSEAGIRQFYDTEIEKIKKEIDEKKTQQYLDLLNMKLLLLRLDTTYN